MRGYGWLLCIGIVFIYLTGCGDSNNSPSPLTPSVYETVNTMDGVSMAIKEGTISPTSTTVTLENHSDKHCIYGEDFALEKKYKGGWYQVPVIFEGNHGFNAIGYDLAPADRKEWTIGWEWLYGSLDAGNYRIVKEILDFRGSGDYDKHYLAAEFTVH